MTLTLLLDLDDTLLGNDIDIFLPAYLKLLGKHLMDYVAPDRMVKNLLAATQVMLSNNSATLNLERSFDQAFYTAIGRTKEEMRPLLEAFYQDNFPALQPLTNQRPEAIEMVAYALKQGHTAVVATNPIFPRQAILHRLKWAGLEPEKVPFALITDYERFHFAKPNPAFFAEILAQLGWPNQPAVVIGNSLQEDIVPANQLGLPAFWVTLKPEILPEGFHPLSSCGSIAQIPAWLKKVDSAGLRQNFTTPPALLAVLKSTPAAFDTLSLGLTGRQWQERPAENEWSLAEILCHLRDVDREVNIPRLNKLFQEENPFLPGINTDPWAEERDYLHQDGRAALREFIDGRATLIERLESLSETDWQRQVRHAIFGPTSLKELIGFTVTHDRSHVQQGQAAVSSLA